MIDQGYYWAKPIGGVLTTTKNGAAQFAVEFALEGGEEKRTVFLHTSDKAWPYTEEKLKRLGWDGNAEQMGFACDRIELACAHETYEGKTKEKWEIAKEQSEFSPAGDDVKRQVLARWKAGNKAAPARKPDVAPAAPPARSAPPRAAAPARKPTPMPQEKAADETEAWGVFYQQCIKINASRTQKSIEEEFDQAVAHVAKGRDKAALTEADWTEIANSAIPF